MKVAIIHSGDPSNMKGIMNFVHEKAYRMQNLKQDKIQVDLFCIRQEYTRVFTWVVLRKKYIPLQSHPSSDVINDVVYHYIWVKYGLYDSIISKKVFKHIISYRYLNKFANLLKGYDVITTHNLECHQIAMKLKTRYCIPVVCTWHGTDIHTTPFGGNVEFEMTKKVIEKADLNYFVSKNLLETSNKITNIGNKQVLYTGPSSIFYRYTDEERLRSRKSLSVNAEYIIGFVGNLIDVKNVMVIPEILASLVKKLPLSTKIAFIVAGDGALRSKMEEKLKLIEQDAVFLGNVLPTNIPRIMNGLDILLLPSKNEGLPLVTLEALKCGANVVGSNVGGIPEAIGEKNCFELDSKFVEKISNRMADILINKESPDTLSEQFSWQHAIQTENAVYKQIIK